MNGLILMRTRPYLSCILILMLIAILGSSFYYYSVLRSINRADYSAHSPSLILANPGQGHHLHMVDVNSTLPNIWLNCAKHRSIRAHYRSESEMLIQAGKCHSFEQDLIPKWHTNISEVTPPPRIAFLFIVRGRIPHEAMWRRFFSSSPREDLYSLYVHTNQRFKFPRSSIFHCKEIPSEKVARFSFSVVDAMRRLLAHSLLDKSLNNQRFVFVCESSIPIQNFAYVYDFLISYNLSFVQAFKPPKEYYSWNTMPEFSWKELRKGEMWMTLTRQHAAMVVSDLSIYKKFKANCKRHIRVCTPDEQYIQTLLSLRDPIHISNKTLMYVDWSRANLEKGSPSSFSKNQITPNLIRGIRKHKQQFTLSVESNHNNNCLRLLNNQTHILTGHSNLLSISYLFARKFSKDAAPYLARLSKNVLHY